MVQNLACSVFLHMSLVLLITPLCTCEFATRLKCKALPRQFASTSYLILALLAFLSLPSPPPPPPHPYSSPMSAFLVLLILLSLCLLENMSPVHCIHENAEDVSGVGTIRKEMPCRCRHSKIGRVQMCVQHIKLL